MKKNLLITSLFFALLFLSVPAAYTATPTVPTVPTGATAPTVLAPTTAEQYVHLGNVAGRQEKYKQAIQDYTKAIDARPDFANAYYNRGYVYIEMKKYKLAIADLNKAIDINPQYTAAYHLRGIAYFLKKKYAQAITEYSKAIDLDPSNIRFHISRMSAYFKMGDTDGAWKDVIKIQQLGGTVNPAILNILKGKKYSDNG